MFIKIKKYIIEKERDVIMANRSGKKEFIRKYVEVANARAEEGAKKVTLKEAEAVLENLQDTVAELVAEVGDVLDLRGFNRWEKYVTPERQYHNPQTGEMGTAPAKEKVKSQAKF